MKLKLIIAGVIASLLFSIVNGILNARELIGSLETQNHQLASALERKELEHQKAINELVKQRLESEKLRAELDESFAKLDAESRALENELSKLSRNKKSVKDWLDTRIPVDIVRLHDPQTESNHDDKNRNH